MSDRLEITPIHKLPLLKAGDDLASMIIERAKAIGFKMRNRDVLVVGQKAVSKSEGRLVDIRTIKPSAHATRLSKRTGKSAQFIETVLRESAQVLRADGNAFIVITRDGQTCLNAGVDKSNVKGDHVFALLPQDPDASARRLMRRVKELTGKQIGIVVTDTRSRPFRRGQVEECIGVAGMNPMVDYRGQKDLFGYKLRFKNVDLADELASAAELVMGQGREATPVAIIRGLRRVRFQERTSSRKLSVMPKEDLFKGTL